MKSVVVYKIHRSDVANVRDEIKDEELLSMFKFSQCTQAQKQTAGFSPVFGGTYVHETKQGDLVLKYTTQNKTINKNEVVNKAAELLPVYLEELAIPSELFSEIKADNTEQYREIMKDVANNASFEVLKTTFPNEAKDMYIVITKEGYIYAEGNWNGAEKALSAIRSAIGSLPAVPVQYDTAASEVFRKFIVEKYSEDITLGEKVILETPEGGKITFANESAYEDKVRDRILDDGCSVAALQLDFDGCFSALVRENMTVNAISYDSSLSVLDEEDREQDESIQMEVLFLLQFNKLRDFHVNLRSILKETSLTETEEGTEDA